MAKLFNSPDEKAKVACLMAAMFRAAAILMDQDYPAEIAMKDAKTIVDLAEK